MHPVNEDPGLTDGQQAMAIDKMNVGISVPLASEIICHNKIPLFFERIPAAFIPETLVAWDVSQKNNGDGWLSGSKNRNKFRQGRFQEIQVRICDVIQSVGLRIDLADRFGNFRFTSTITGKAQVHDLPIK